MTNSNVNLEASLPELLEFTIFAGMTKSQVQDLCVNGKIVTTSHREPLFRAGENAEYFGLVLGGAYKLTRISPLGEDVIVHFSTPGDVVAAFIMVQPKPVYPVSVISMGPSRFLKLARSNYLDKWKNFPELIFRVQNLLSVRMSLLQDQRVLLKAPLPQKVAALLVELLERGPSGDALELPLPLTRKEIAETLGATVESVIRIMSDWSKSGIIQTNDQYIRILKLEKILEILKV